MNHLSIKDIRYAIRCKGKYFRYNLKIHDGEHWEWISGLSRADISDKTVCEYRIKKFGITGAEIVTIEVGDYNNKTITSRDRKVVDIITREESTPDANPNEKTLKHWDIVLPGGSRVRLL